MNYSLAYIYIALMVAVLAPASAAVWVVADASSIRRLEIHSCGLSDCSPRRWAAAVFLLPPVGIPMYLKFRRERQQRLEQYAVAGAD